jgi:hypothetical protein
MFEVVPRGVLRRKVLRRKVLRRDALTRTHDFIVDRNRIPSHLLWESGPLRRTRRSVARFWDSQRSAAADELSKVSRQ